MELGKFFSDFFSFNRLFGPFTFTIVNLKKGPAITSELHTARAHALYLCLLPFLAPHMWYSDIYNDLISESLGTIHQLCSLHFPENECTCFCSSWLIMGPLCARDKVC